MSAFGNNQAFSNSLKRIKTKQKQNKTTTTTKNKTKQKSLQSNNNKTTVERFSVKDASPMTKFSTETKKEKKDKEKKTEQPNHKKAMIQSQIPDLLSIGCRYFLASLSTGQHQPRFPRSGCTCVQLLAE